MLIIYMSICRCAHVCRYIYFRVDHVLCFTIFKRCSYYFRFNGERVHSTYPAPMLLTGVPDKGPVLIFLKSFLFKYFRLLLIHCHIITFAINNSSHFSAFSYNAGMNISHHDFLYEYFVRNFNRHR